MQQMMKRWLMQSLVIQNYKSMKYLNKICIVIFAVLPGVIQAELFLIDQITKVVCGPEANTPFTDTGVTWKRSLDNKFITIEQQIQREIVSQQLVADKIPMDPTAVEKYIDGIKKQNNFSESDLETWFGDVGRTMAEGIEGLTEQYNNEYFMHYKFKSQLVPTDDELREYYDENPLFVDGWYEVRATRIEYAPENKAEAEEAVAQLIKSDSSSIEWTAPVRIAEDDLTDGNRFIEKMSINEITTLEVDNAIELYQLIAYEPTKLVTLEERRTTIADALNRKKLEKMLADYNRAIREYIDVITLV